MKNSTRIDMNRPPDTGRSVDALAQAVLASQRYRSISPHLVRELGARELAKRRNIQEAIKATKAKLHQIGGAYITSSQYARWLNELARAYQTDGLPSLQQICRQVMSYHASTRERLPILEQFYATILADLPPARVGSVPPVFQPAGVGKARVVLDLACGLHPLALPWMPLAADVEYYAYDIYQDMADFLNGFLALVGVRGRAEVCNVLSNCPTRHADLALLLKAIPCLEQIDASAGLRLLETINADHLLVSFPAQSLGGRQKGMARTYEAHFRHLVAGKPWTIKRFEFATELAFLIRK
jgi:16S rRNA (guanine(1405)-N(7))-methyltransferase